MPSAAATLTDRDRQRLEALLDALPAPLEPLDLSALDGFLVGVLLQPKPVPASRWLPHVHDLDARTAPPGVPLDELHALVKRRHAELDRAITQRRWFDPWVFELEPDIESAAISGRSMTPQDAKAPAAMGSASEL